MTNEIDDGGPAWPETLPEIPVGYSKQLIMHISMSDKKSGRYGSATYSVLDPNGAKTPIQFSYNSHKTDGYRGLSVIGGDGTIYATWKELAAAWPALLAARKPGAAG